MCSHNISPPGIQASGFLDPTLIFSCVLRKGIPTSLSYHIIIRWSNAIINNVIFFLYFPGRPKTNVSTQNVTIALMDHWLPSGEGWVRV